MFIMKILLSTFYILTAKVDPREGVGGLGAVLV